MLLISSKHAAEYTVVFNCVPHVPQAVLIFISTAAAHMNDSGKPRGSEATPSYFASLLQEKEVIALIARRKLESTWSHL